MNMVLKKMRKNGTTLLFKLRAQGRRMVDGLFSVVDRITYLQAKQNSLLKRLMGFIAFDLKNGGYRPNIILCGSEGRRVEISIRDKYNRIPLNKGKELRHLSGGHYDDLFEVKTQVILKRKTLKDQEFMIKLIRLCGGKREFRKLFIVKEWIAPKNNFTVARYLLFDDGINRAFNKIVSQWNPVVNIYGDE